MKAESSDLKALAESFLGLQKRKLQGANAWLDDDRLFICLFHFQISEPARTLHYSLFSIMNKTQRPYEIYFIRMYEIDFLLRYH